jgi:hypothetical protein
MLDLWIYERTPWWQMSQSNPQQLERGRHFACVLIPALDVSAIRNVLTLMKELHEFNLVMKARPQSPTPVVEETTCLRCHREFGDDERSCNTPVKVRCQKKHTFGLNCN